MEQHIITVITRIKNKPLRYTLENIYKFSILKSKKNL